MAREEKCPIAKMVCPRNNDPQRGKYCPCWTEYTETNLQTGEERLTKECFFDAMPRFMIETVKACNRPAAALEYTRNELAKGLTHVASQLQHLPRALAEQSSQSQQRLGRDANRDEWEHALIATDQDADPNPEEGEGKWD